MIGVHTTLRYCVMIARIEMFIILQFLFVLPLIINYSIHDGIQIYTKIDN